MLVMLKALLRGLALHRKKGFACAEPFLRRAPGMHLNYSVTH